MSSKIVHVCSLAKWINLRKNVITFLSLEFVCKCSFKNKMRNVLEKNFHFNFLFVLFSVSKSCFLFLSMALSKQTNTRLWAWVYICVSLFTIYVTVWWLCRKPYSKRRRQEHAYKLISFVWMKIFNCIGTCVSWCKATR